MGRVARGLVASSGYLGSSVVGCLLVAATRNEKRARPILWAIGAFMLFTLVFWIRNAFGALVVLGWGYFLYQGVVDPLGGINTLWQLFGVGNQMLAGIALLLCTSMLVKMKRERYVWVTLVPTAWLLLTTLTAGVQKIFSSDPAIGFIALARKFSDAAAQGTVLAPAKSIAEMQRVAFNNYLDAAVCAFFVLLVVAMCAFAAKICLQALRQAYPTAQEIPPPAAAAGASA